MSLLDGPKIPKRMPHYLELEEVQRLLNAILENDDEFYKLRDYSIIMLFLNTGLRLSELLITLALLAGAQPLLLLLVHG